MTKVGIGLPGTSIAEVRASAEAASRYEFDSFSVYGDLGDLPPYAALHSSADLLRLSTIDNIGPMGVPVGLQHPEIIALHAVALEQQLPGRTYLGLVRGAFLSQIGEKPASLASLEQAVISVRKVFYEHGLDIPVYLGGFGPRLLNIAGHLPVQAIKLGGSANAELAKLARAYIDNPHVNVVMGAVSVIDEDRQSARQTARREVAKYLDVVGGLDPTLDEDELGSLADFMQRFAVGDVEAGQAISDSLLDKFAIAGTPEDAMSALERMNGQVDRFEFGTPHGLGDRPSAIGYIGNTILRDLEQ